MAIGMYGEIEDERARGCVMTRQEAIQRLSELSCAYEHIRMTDCPHCASEVESLVVSLTREPDAEGETRA